MTWIFVVGLMLLIFAAAAWLKANPPSSRAALYPYVKNPSLFTPAERSFLGITDQLLGRDYRVMGKVRIADLVSVEPLDNKKAWQGAFNQISAQHFNFVLCNKEDLTPVAVIELDDKSQTAEKRRQRDEFIEGVCQAASLPLIRLPALHSYTRSNVERLVLNRLPQRFSAPSASAADFSPARPIADAPAASLTNREQVKSPQCPKCSSHMILRKVKRGARAGEKLWSCRGYPSCRGILPVTASGSPQPSAPLRLNKAAARAYHPTLTA